MQLYFGLLHTLGARRPSLIFEDSKCARFFATHQGRWTWRLTQLARRNQHKRQPLTATCLGCRLHWFLVVAEDSRSSWSFQGERRSCYPYCSKGECRGRGPILVLPLYAGNSARLLHPSGTTTLNQSVCWWRDWSERHLNVTIPNVKESCRTYHTHHLSEVPARQSWNSGWQPRTSWYG